MELTLIDIITFIAFIATVIVISIYASRKEETVDDYFLAGRRLGWGLIGFSLLASNISSEHFIGMSGEGFGTGLAIASFEWIACPALIFVALVLLPRFLRSGIYTIPEYLEYRYTSGTRSVMAFYFMLAYIFVAMAGVLYAGALALQSMFGMSLIVGVWSIGILAGGYTIYGGLKAVVWTDLIQGATLLVGGLVVTAIGFQAIGGMGNFFENNHDKLHLLLPSDHPDMPWTIILLGIWIPNIFYWGCNQFITQRALGAKSLEEGQRGVIFAAYLKILIPVITVFPGIIAFQLYRGEITHQDMAYAFLIKKILPIGLRGIMFAALFGAVMSSLDSMLNSASTIFTIDLYQRHLAKTEVRPKRMILIGRIMTGIFVIIACLWAPFLSQMGGLYKYMQVFWGSISPAVCAVFIVGLISKRVPGFAGMWALILGPPLYLSLIALFEGNIYTLQICGEQLTVSASYLNLMGVTFLTLSALMLIARRLRPLSEPISLPVRDTRYSTETGRMIKFWAALNLVIILGLYIYFR